VTRLRVAAALIVVLAVTPAALATNYGVFVDGSYSPGDASTAMDRLIDGRLADADRIMGERDPQSRRQTVDSKEALRRALAGIRCTCQDTVTVVLMGHGEENRFIFSKARRDADRRLGARELADLLEASAAECKILGVRPDRAATLYRAVGCDHCDYQGYRGRMAIMELLKMDGELDEMIARRVTARELLKAAIAKGFRTLADDGIRRVLDGSTGLDELVRVVDLTDRM